jgi:hypothetical protein
MIRHYDYQLSTENIKTDPYRRISLEFDQVPTEQEVVNAIESTLGEDQQLGWYFFMESE